jgi:DNA repair exonuclease SbcCD ATPase subunit
VKVYDIDLLHQMASHLEGLEKDLDSKAKSLETDYIRPDQIKDQIEESQDRIRLIESGLEPKTKELESTEKLLEEIPDAVTLKKVYELSIKLESLQREIELKSEGLDEDLTLAGIVDASATILNARLDALEKGRERIEGEKKSIKSKIQDVDREIGIISGIHQDLEDKIQTLTKAGADDIVECPTCAKPLSSDERDRLVSEYKTTIENGEIRINELEGEKKDLVVTSDDFDDQLTRMSKSQDAVKRVSQGQKRVNLTTEELTKARQELALLLEESGIKSIDTLLKNYKVESLLDLQKKVVKFETNLKALRKEILESEENIQREQERITNLQLKQTDMERIGAEIVELENMNEHTKYVRRRLVSGFVTDYVFQKRLLGIIRGATNPYVRAFTNGQYTSIDLEPTPAKGRSGPGLILKIWDERDQAWKKTSQLSYGDRTAISLGLRMGISRTMSSIRPLKDSPVVTPRVRSVLLDEPLGGLDKSRREAVVRTLVNDQSFEQILLITHTDIQGWEGIPVIDVSKTGAASNAVLEM